jgi:tRNA pseudouridine38-40 synthase
MLCHKPAMRLKLTLQYHGHGLGGWQYQPAQGTPKLPSVQGEMCAAFNKLLVTHRLAPKELVAAGRTDAGVHAHGQVVHVDVPDDFTTRPLYTWVEGLNRYLPLTIRVVRAQIMPLSFHARYSATARHYVYKLWVARHLRPDLLYCVGHAPPRFAKAIKIEAIHQAVATLPVGIPTDFSSLRDAECQSKMPICTLSHARLVQAEPDLLELHLGADHFLHHMVRNLVGTLVQVAMNERDPDLHPLLAAQNRTLAGTTFAPDGLYLMGVDYPPLTAA